MSVLDRCWLRSRHLLGVTSGVDQVMLWVPMRVASADLE